MLSYLVNPSSRWEVLRLLWGEGLTGSVRDLATLAKVSYSSAHSELRGLERVGLAVSEAVGSATVYRANKDHAHADALSTLVNASDEPETAGKLAVESMELLAHLKRLGAPLTTAAAPTLPLSSEEVVAQGLRLARRDPTVARSFPVLIARNRDKLDFERVSHQAKALREKQALGFFLDLTGLLANDDNLRLLARHHKDRRIKRVRDFFVGQKGRYATQLAELHTPELAKEWNFRMDMSMQSFEQLFRKFVQ